MPKKKTHDEYVIDVTIKNPNIEVLDTYMGAKIKIKHRCKIHNICWDISPDKILSGRGCPQCGKEQYYNSRCKTHDEYYIDLQNKLPHIIPLEKYINAQTSILHYCTIHDYEWNVMPNDILTRNTGCPICGKETYSNKRKISHDEYCNKLTYKNPDIIPLEKYIGYDIPILHFCKIHNEKWKISPSNALVGKGCSQCRKEKLHISQRKTNEQYCRELNEKNPTIISLEEYINKETHILHKCLNCGYEWKVVPNSLLQGCGCPNCISSKSENFISKWLTNHNINFISQMKFEDCCDIRSLPFDFYLPDYNKCIEFDGEQHYRIVDYFGGEEGFKIRQYHDQIKNEYCKQNNIPLLRIPYYADIETELENFLLAS